MWLRFRTLHLGLTHDGFEDVLDMEFQQSEAVVHPISSEWTLLVAQEWLLLESTTPATLVTDRGSPCYGFGFAPSSPRLKKLVGGAFHCFLQLDVRLDSVQDLAPRLDSIQDLALTGDVIIHHMLV